MIPEPTGDARFEIRNPKFEISAQCYRLSSEPKKMDLPHLYRHMLRARSYELAVEDLWDHGLISGAMHLGAGEEAVAAGVVTQLGDGGTRKRWRLL